MRLRSIRSAARTLLVALAAVQGWIFRHSVSPDGVAYLDLSDAITSFRIGDIVNGYWSPLYPALIGLARLIVAPTPLGEPYWEFAVVHVVNVACFVLALWMFERFLAALDTLPGAPSRSPALMTAAYVMFGIATLGMISIEGTVPDMLLCALLFGAFACALRMTSTAANRKRVAIELGALLGAAALTKSIMFPLGAVMIATIAAVAWRQRPVADLARAVAIFAIITLPFVLALSLQLGKLSTGETGSLNYSWYVNHQQPANSGIIPSLAAPPESLPLSGVGILRDAQGTNPLWYDPARWHGNLEPRFSLAQQIVRLKPNLLYYLGTLAPILLALAAIGSGLAWRDLRAVIARTAVVVVPGLAALVAYAMVYATSRYAAPFLATSIVALAAALPRSAVLRAGPAVFVALAGVLLLDLISPVRGRVVLAYAVALAAPAWLLAARFESRRILATGLITAGGMIVLILLPKATMLALLAVAMLAAFVLLPRSDRHRELDIRAIRVVGATGILMLLAATTIGSAHAVLRWQAAQRGEAHPEWALARRLRGEGIATGATVGVIGNPERSGWARLNRNQIVAVVPAHLAGAFAALSTDDRATVERAFASAGATRLVTLP